MGCQYCGKEIGLVRQLRDREFCSAAHRKSYGARLGRALEDLGAPAPPPAAVAGFRIDMPLQSGNLSRAVAVFDFGRNGSAVELRGACPVSISGVRGQGAKTLTGSHWAPFGADLCARSDAGPSVYCPGLQFPRFELAAEDGMPFESGGVAEAPPLAGAFWNIQEANEAGRTVVTPEVARRTAPIFEPAAMAMVASPLVIGIRGLVAAPVAEAVEALWPPAPYAREVAFPAAVALTQAWALEAIDEWAAAPGMCGPVAAPAAEVVEALLPVTPCAEAMAFPVAVAMRSAWALEAIDEWAAAPGMCGPVPAPAAEVVEALLPVTPYAEAMAFPAVAAMRIAWVPEPIGEVSLEFAGCGVMAAPVAEAVEALLPPAPYAAEIAFPAAAAMGIAWVPEPIREVSLVFESCGVMAAPAAEAAETLFPATPMAPAAEFASSAARLPELAMAVVPEAETETVEDVSKPVEVVPPSESWMTPPPACEVEREIWQVVAAALPLEAAVQAPGAAALAIAEPIMRETAGLRRTPLAEPVVAYVSARLAESIAEVALQSAAFCVPDLAGLGVSGKRQSAPAAPAAEQQLPKPVEPERGASLVAAPAAAAGAGVIRFPGLVLAPATGSSTGTFRAPEAGAAVPETAVPNDRAARLEPLSTISIVPPTTGADQLGAAFPQGQLVPMEFFCQRAPMAPQRNLAWLTRSIPAVLPRFAMRTAFDRLEDLALIPMARQRETPSFTEIFSIANAARRPQPSHLSAPARAIAAALLIGVGLWFGAGAAKIGRQLLAVNSNWPSEETPSSSTGRNSSTAFARVRSVFVPPSPRAAEGPVEKVRRAIQSRAAAELSDTFRGMEAWGAAAALPAGWSRHADGYMRTGQLALYHPSLTFTDYRLEFFGQIESKGMGWVVRASDQQNYYGMKFKVVEPGLRQVLAVVHYPVVGGKQGERVETPLSVMIHDRTPYHVAVDVKGNRVTTSIEGEEVDSWTDDSLRVGGVGFFSDAGESAHLYWMKITKNQDWLGRVCAYLSGNAGNAVTGDLWRDDYAPAPAPRPSPRPSPDAILAAVESDEFPYHSPPRARILTNGRTEPCKS